MRSNDAAAVPETLATWRRDGADHLDPMRFRFIEALQRRASACEGETRRLLDARLYALVRAYADDLAKAAAVGEKQGDASAGEPARETLAALLEHMAEPAPAVDGEGNVGQGQSTFPELAALGEFRQRWSGLRAERQLRQTQVPAPAQAGPLNSGVLVHRSLVLMREVSPGYLRQFLSYLDALAWLERIHDSGAVSSPDATRATPVGKRGSRARRARG